MFLNLLLLLFCFVGHCGTTLIPVTGKTGSNVTLSCEFEARDIFHINLNSWSKNIPVCENEDCESENGRVFKTGSCDVIIKDLIFSDAGRYTLRIYYSNDQTEVEQQIRKYQLHIQDEISVKTGEELKMDVLLTNADKVEKSSSGEWTEVWRRGHGVRSDRLTDSDGKLTIKEFTVTDTGTYRVLDSEGGILITVTVTESGPTGEDKASTHPDQELSSWPQKVNGYFVMSLVFVYLVIMAIQIVMRVTGFW